MAAMATVRMMVLVPPDRSLISGRWAQAKLAMKLMATSAPIMRLSLAGGIMTQMNMPKSATLRALTAATGRRLPAITPRAVPTDQPGRATLMAP